MLRLGKVVVGKVRVELDWCDPYLCMDPLCGMGGM